MRIVHFIIYLCAIAGTITVASCKKDDFNRREEWPVSGVENIDTEWFRKELSDNNPRFIDSNIALHYTDGGIIHSYTDGDRYSWRFIELSTGIDVRFSYSLIDEKSAIISDPILTINDKTVKLRHAKLEQDRNSTKWISMSTPDKSQIVIVVNQNIGL